MLDINGVRVFIRGTALIDQRTKIWGQGQANNAEHLNQN